MKAGDQYIYLSGRIEALRSKQRRTDPPFGGELGEANALAGIQPLIIIIYFVLPACSAE
jgi:hypothetical protein